MACSKLVYEAGFTGAGIALVEYYRNHAKNRKGLAVMVFRDRKTGKWSILGGRRDGQENAKTTARREAREESGNWIRLSDGALDPCDAVRHHDFVTFFVLVQHSDGIQSRYYRNNLKILQRNHAPHDYLETDAVTRVYVDQMFADGVTTRQGDFQTTDANGHAITIEARSKAVIRKGLNGGVFERLPWRPVTLRSNLNFEPRKLGSGFLQGTGCYHD